MTALYDFSGGMESAAMLVLERERILNTGAIVRWADTGKQFPEMEASLSQVEAILGIQIFRIAPRIIFDEFLFQKGGIVRNGTNDCSRRMKRGNLRRHMLSLPKPYEINLGYNASEYKRAEEWIELNERDWCHWRFPLIEMGVERQATWKICRDAGFSILVEMYEKMGRFDCFWCGNQKFSQALKVVDHYPDLAAEWMEAEKKKGHSFMKIPLRVLVEERERQGLLDFGSSTCACFGGTEDYWKEEAGS